MNGSLFRGRWVVVSAVGLAVGALALLVGLHAPAAPSPWEVGNDDTVGTFGFGHVDVEGGVAALSPSMPGRVTKVAVTEGSTVHQGDLLLCVEDRVARLRVAEARAALEGAGRRLALAQKGVRDKELKLAQQQALLQAIARRLAAAELARDRKRDQVQRELLNPVEARLAEELVREIQAQVQAEQVKAEQIQLLDPQIEVQLAQADVRAAQAHLEQADEAQTQCLLSAPADGMVLRVLVSAGDLVGGQPGQPAVQFWPTHKPLIVRAEIDQESASGLREGDAVRLWDYYCSHSFTGTGRVRHISRWFAAQRTILNEPGRFQDARTLECVIGDLQCAGQDAARLLRIGQRMRVEILRSNSTRCPSNLSLQRPQSL
jgi:multidrug resistance efflux pump